MPIDWTELTSKLDPRRFSVATVADRLRLRPDPWREYFSLKQRFTRTTIAALEGLAG